MNKKLVGIGIGVAIAVALVIFLGMPSYKAPVENINQSNTQIPNATKPVVTGRHITVELNESMPMSTR